MTWLLHPVVVFSALWVGVIGLCALGLLLLWPAPSEPWSDERRRLAALAGLFVSDRGVGAARPSLQEPPRSGSPSASVQARTTPRAAATVHGPRTVPPGA